MVKLHKCGLCGRVRADWKLYYMTDYETNTRNWYCVEEPECWELAEEKRDKDLGIGEYDLKREKTTHLNDL